jgi:hypothetical protein
MILEEKHAAHVQILHQEKTFQDRWAYPGAEVTRVVAAPNVVLGPLR